MRTGRYRIINADIVYEGELETVNKLTGEISFAGKKKSDKVVGYFAHFELTNGFVKTLYMTKDEVIAHAKKFSKSYNHSSSAWNSDFDAMAKKTVIRGLLSHWGYLSVEMVDAISEDIRSDESERDQDVEMKTASKTFEVEDTEYQEIPEEQSEVQPEF